MTHAEDDNKDYQHCITICQKILHTTTGIILGSFALIVVMTTVSTGPLVRGGGKALYYIILFSILVSLVTWYLRVRMEKRIAVEENSS